MSIERGRDLQPGDLAIVRAKGVKKITEFVNGQIVTIRSEEYFKRFRKEILLCHLIELEEPWNGEKFIEAAKRALIPLGPPQTFKETRKEVAA